MTLNDKSDIFSLTATLIYLSYGSMPPAVRALGPLANEGWEKAAASMPHAWISNLLATAVNPHSEKRPTAKQFFKELTSIGGTIGDALDGPVEF